MTTTVVVSITVVSEDPAQIMKAAEVLACAAAGLVLDGISVSVALNVVEDEDG